MKGRLLCLAALLPMLVGCASLPRGLPPIPSSAPTQIGPIPVKRVRDLMCGADRALGCFHADSFYIEIDEPVALAVAWQTLRHELGHAALFVAGIRIPSPDAENLIVDAMASQVVNEMRAGWPR